MDPSSNVELLARVPLFDDLSQEELERIAAVAVPRSYPRGVRVFHEGDQSDACYIVRSGNLRVTREHSDGRAITLATLGPGDFFGELAVLAGVPRTATVVADTDMVIEALNRQEFSSLLDESPAIAKKVLLAAVKRLYANDTHSIH